jgi:Tfp pilus assembly protein PilN
MLDQYIMTRQEALDRLRDFNIQGEDVYLIDLIPLIEMIWSDGQAQASEIGLFKDYLIQHVEKVNRMAGYKMLTIDKAERFISRFLKERPSSQLLETLRSLIPPLRLSSSDSEANEDLRSSLLQGCLDIAASSVTQYPYESMERFCSSEKKCWFEIFETLHQTGQAQGDGSN